MLGRKADADAFNAEVTRRKRTADLELLTAGRQTLAEFAEEWWELYAAPNLAARTLRSYAGLWDRHVLPRIGSARLNTITPEMVERFRVELEADHVGAPTVYRALTLLQGVMRRAVEWRRIGYNPVKSVPKPRVRRQREVRPLPPTTVEGLRSAAIKRRKHGFRDATLIALIAYAGLRPQEALALTWGDVRKRTLLVEKATDGMGGVKATKTEQARTVRLLGPLAQDLAELRAIRGGVDESSLLLPNAAGAAWNDGGWQSWHRDAWKPACKSLHLEGTRPYDLRHSFVSLLIHEGRSVVDVARQAGHSPTMALDVYAHDFDEFDIAERVSAEDQIERARRGVSVLCPPSPDDGSKLQETPANGHSPNCLPKISFRILERGTPGLQGSFEDKHPQQMRLF